MLKSIIYGKNNLYRFYLIGFFVILALPILSLPPYFSPPDWAKTVVFKIVFSIIAFVFLYQVLWQKNIDFLNKVGKKNILFWLLILLFVVYLLATIFSVDIRFSLWGSPFRGGGVLNYLFYILFALLSFSIIQKKDWQKLWDFSILIGVLVSIIALISRFGLLSNIFLTQIDQLTSTIGGPTILGLYLILLVFPALSFGIQEKNKIKKSFYFLSFLLFCWVILLTISQGAYLGLAVGTLYFLFFFSIKNLPAQVSKKIFYVKLAAVMLIVLSLTAVLIIKSQPQNPINNNYLFSTLTNWRMDQSRLSAWKVSAKAFLERPILGWGPENFAIAFDKHYDPSLPRLQKNPLAPDSWWDRAHNFVFNILVEAGLLGLMSFVLLFGFIFFRLYKLSHLQNNYLADDKLTAHGLQTALVAYFADLFFNFDSFSSFIILFLIVGYSLSFTPKREDEVQTAVSVKMSKLRDFVFKNLSAQAGGKIAVSVLFLIVIYFIWFLNINPLMVNAKINKAQYFSDNKKCQQSLVIMDRVLPKHTIIDGYLRLKYIDFIRACSKTSTENDLVFAKRGIELLKENAKIMPYYTRNWLFLGALNNVLIAREQNQETKKALIEEGVEYYKKANELSPKRQEVFVEWIKKDLVSGDYQKAREKADKCINLNPNIPECHWFKGVMEIYFNNPDEAKKEFKIAADFGFGGEDIASLNQLVNAYVFVKNYKELALVYQKLILKENIPQYHASLAFVYRELGQYEKAREEALMFLKLMPEVKEVKDEVDTFLKTLPH